MVLSWVSWVLKKLWAGFSWVSWALKFYELGLAGLAGFIKIKVGFNWIFWVSNTLPTEKVYGAFLNLKILKLALNIML